MAYRAYVGGYQSDPNSTSVAAVLSILDLSINQTVGGLAYVDLNSANIVDSVSLRAETISASITWFAGQGATVVAGDIIFPQDSANLPAPTSYQTIVSQTGTSAPAVSGGFTPTSTYTAGTTFTWARTGAGVYTLTASAAVFNTSGKTGVFITPPQNLNGSFRAVVTSSTVITVTTAVQSLAVLGLLGFTSTNTDALLNNTMIYVQTYS